MLTTPTEGSTGSGDLLNRRPPPDYLREWTERVARVEEFLERGTKAVLVFRVGPEWLALPVQVFQEVAEEWTVHSIPHRRGVVLGIVAVRGELLLCASLAALLGVEQSAGVQKSRSDLLYARLLVVQAGESRVAFPADEVHGVVRYHPEELKPVPATLPQSEATFAIGMLSWQGMTIGCLDSEALFGQLNNSFG